MKRFNAIIAGVILSLSSSVMAYIPDRCDWQDCEALARGESGSSGWGWIVLIIIGIIIFSKSE